MEIIPFLSIAIRNAQNFEQALQEAQWSNCLLGLARCMFEQLDSIDSVVRRIMVNAAALLECEKCSVFMVDFATNELYSRIFDISPDSQVDLDPETINEHVQEIRFPMHVGIAGHVATTGDLLNIPDAYVPQSGKECSK